MDKLNRLVIVGNGFDLAHGLKTSYSNFIDWYMCDAFERFRSDKYYSDPLVEIKNEYSGQTTDYQDTPLTMKGVLDLISINDYQSITYPSNFMRRLVNSFQTDNWVDIEQYYFRLLKGYFSNPNLQNKKEVVKQLNSEFSFIIEKLADYIEVVNASISNVAQLPAERSKCNMSKAFEPATPNSELRFLNFNYTETLQAKAYANDNEVIHIHGRASASAQNPIIFGYGDESDPIYQAIEDSGENIYLEHIKSFGYFRTNNYQDLLSYIDSDPFIVYIIGHSCGLSDRVLLNEIFEHRNCKSIEVFFYKRSDGSDNFKEITQEISRHFKPNNKNLMRRRIKDFDQKNFIPQNKL